MQIKNNIHNPKEINDKNKTEQAKNIPSSDEFQKEIDKKINKENKQKDNNEIKDEKNKINPEEKTKIDTKDLTTLKLFVLPYINKDLLSISLKDLADKDLNHKNNINQNKLETNQKLIESIQQENILTNKEDKKKKNYSNTVDFNPFSSFEKLNNSLKEISKEEKVKESKIVKELIEKLDVQKLQDSRLVEIKFSKENIGNLSVQIINQDNKVSVVFKTDSKFLYDELKNNKDLLKQMLNSRNLKAEKIIIDYEEVK